MALKKKFPFPFCPLSFYFILFFLFFYYDMSKRQFIPDKDLLNPKFDGYKLSPINEEEYITRTSLPNGSDLRMSKSLSNHRLGYRDLQARVRLNHLAYGFSMTTDQQQQGVAFYVDLEFQVMRLIYNKVVFILNFCYLYWPSLLLRSIHPSIHPIAHSCFPRIGNNV